MARPILRRMVGFFFAAAAAGAGPRALVRGESAAAEVEENSLTTSEIRRWRRGERSGGERRERAVVGSGVDFSSGVSQKM